MVTKSTRLVSQVNQKHFVFYQLTTYFGICYVTKLRTDLNQIHYRFAPSKMVLIGNSDFLLHRNRHFYDQSRGLFADTDPKNFTESGTLQKLMFERHGDSTIHNWPTKYE